MRMLTSISVDEISLSKCVNWSTYFRGLLFNEEMTAMGKVAIKIKLSRYVTIKNLPDIFKKVQYRDRLYLRSALPTWKIKLKKKNILITFYTVILICFLSVSKPENISLQTIREWNLARLRNYPVDQILSLQVVDVVKTLHATKRDQAEITFNTA